MWIKLASFQWPDGYFKKKIWSASILCPIFSPSFLRSKHSLLPWDAVQICIHTNACNKMPFPTPAIHATWDFNKIRLQSDLKSTKLSSWDQQKNTTDVKVESKLELFLGCKLFSSESCFCTPLLSPPRRGSPQVIKQPSEPQEIHWHQNSCPMLLLVMHCFTAIYLYYLHETQSTLLYNYTKPIARHPSFQPCLVFMVLIHLRCFQFSRPTWSIQWAKPVRLRPCEAGPRIAAKADSMAASCSMSYSCLKVLADSKYQAVSSLWASFVQPSTQSEFKDTSVTEVIQIPTKQSSIRVSKASFRWPIQLANVFAAWWLSYFFTVATCPVLSCAHVQNV